MLAWWTLIGTTDVYADRVDAIAGTDGYRIIASHLWRDISTTTATGLTNSPTTITAGLRVVRGTCVETLDYDGVTLAAGTDNQGNSAICHWFYSFGLGTTTATASVANVTYHTLNGASGVNWGETRIYNAYEWGNSGSGLTGANIQSHGTALGDAQGFALSHTALTAFVSGTIYTMSWYQP